MKGTLNWALVGTGGISNRFLAGLRCAEGARPYAAVSRSQEKAEAFAARHGLEKAYGDYGAMLEDPAVDVVYIGTPHVTHRDLAVRAFRAKKAVLCEKPVSINGAELSEMIAEARANGVFFMEAMWTRFVPPLRKVQEWLASGIIGEVKMMQANFCFASAFNPAGRLYNIELGGGALLDAGVYPLSLASLAFGGKRPETLSSVMYRGETGADEAVSVLLSYGGPRIASVSAAISTSAVNDGWIYGTQGRIHLPDFVFSHSASLILPGKYSYRYEGDFVSNGYNYEVEEVTRCIREGKPESEIMSLSESLVIMQTMDRVRAQNGFVYPGEAGSGNSLAGASGGIRV
ncbi:MAG: Gfo/Idh/MocA family oxidoreductase [Treponema sp.]|jgi:predicted dehydrogenase|nr:Gfo/Idh/MocA family oxidoreductase [Treponema sp.]